MDNKQIEDSIKSSITNFKAGLSSRQTRVIAYGAGLGLIIFLLLLVYRPLAINLHQTRLELQGLQAKLFNYRENADALKGLELTGRLMHQNELSFAIDEITEKGRGLGLNFTSIAPGQLQQELRGNFKLLPIAFGIEASYQSLGEFLSYLEELPRTMAEINSMAIRPKNDTSGNLSVELAVKLYMETDNGSK